ncbi:hypothetical protein BZA70DRAFT_291167 [Myxozyma melibiosi]|uniref:Uncharacterized protein n=1 Tax=Myxozyma melibiosi TaxID=54550 RepID=A0ABR1F3D5_9ASCO
MPWVSREDRGAKPALARAHVKRTGVCVQIQKTANFTLKTSLDIRWLPVLATCT